MPEHGACTSKAWVLLTLATWLKLNGYIFVNPWLRAIVSLKWLDIPHTIHVIMQVIFNSTQFLLIPSTKRNPECTFSKIQSSRFTCFSFHHNFSMFVWRQSKYHAKMFFSVLTFICLSASWFLRVADTCQSQIFMYSTYST